MLNNIKMQIEIPTRGRATPSGKALLGAIQNKSLPLLDLLVREVIQNSLDAQIDENKSLSVDVDFSVTEFESRDLAIIFSGIEERLLERHPEKAKCIAIKDKNTKGLTGPIRIGDVGADGRQGNLLNLIYNIQEPQQAAGAGGSWGLGKTVYFCIGIGVVIYYSKFKDENGNVQLRLAAALYESPQPNPLLKVANYRGLAFWGQKDDQCQQGQSIPLQTEESINPILKVLNITPYNDNESGTTVIIPYIDEMRLLEETFPEQTVERNELNLEIPGPILKPYWCSSLQHYISIATLRWYAPRLNNFQYRFGRYLKVSVDGQSIDFKNTSSSPFFELIQDLYNKKCSDETVQVRDIQLNATFQGENRVAGKLAFCKTDKHLLRMTCHEDNLPSPYFWIGSDQIYKNGNPPLICYTRKPGMVVEYTVSGEWVKGIKPCLENEYVIGVFVLNTGNVLEQGPDLEEYIRQGEKADHAMWQDWSVQGKFIKLVERIQKHVRNEISRFLYPPPPSLPLDKTTVGLGVKAARILPPIGFGFGPALPPPPPHLQPPPPRKNKYSLVEILETTYTVSGVQLEYICCFGCKDQKLDVSLAVSTENSSILPSQWEDAVSGFGTPFPVIINSFTVDSLISDSNHLKTSLLINKDSEESATNNGLKVELKYSGIDKIPSAICLTRDSLMVESCRGVICIGLSTSDAHEFNVALEISQHAPFTEGQVSKEAL